MAEKRIIKKYPNRRLYDTEISQYITLDDVKQLVLDGVEFCVKDVKTDEDLTRSILLQIIAEQEHDGQPIFKTAMLSQLIRYYGHSYQSLLSDYLESSMDFFAEQQRTLQQNFREAMSANPLETMSELTEQNLKMWRQMQNNFLQNSFFKAAGFSTKDEKDK